MDNPFPSNPSPPVTLLKTPVNKVKAIILKPTSVINFNCFGDNEEILVAILLNPELICAMIGVNAPPSFIAAF